MPDRLTENARSDRRSATTRIPTILLAGLTTGFLLRLTFDGHLTPYGSSALLVILAGNWTWFTYQLVEIVRG